MSKVTAQHYTTNLAKKRMSCVTGGGSKVPRLLVVICLAYRRAIIGMLEHDTLQHGE